MSVVAPFPYFGGKRSVAADVWARFGDVRNYVEPFFGSGAVLLGRPTPFAGSESVNDLDCYLSNFWRALASDPDGVAAYCDLPVNEVDLHARHLWLLQRDEFRERMKTDPDHYDVKVAGWWVWGLCSWIGTGWCSTPRQRGDGRPPQQLPHLGNAGRGEAIAAYLSKLSARLRGVRVACGSWERVLGPSVTWRHGPTGVFLDPPYAEGDMSYSAGASGSVAADVAAWALENGSNPLLRIAVCGHDGEHAFPDGWEAFAWKARGGYGNQDDDDANDNRHRERIWFSPSCRRVGQVGLLFGGAL